MDGEDDLVLSDDESASEGHGSFALSPNSRHASQENMKVEADEAEDDYTLPSAADKTEAHDDDDYTLEGEAAQGEEGAAVHEDDDELSQAPSVRSPARVREEEAPVEQSQAYSEAFNSEASYSQASENSGYASDFNEVSKSGVETPGKADEERRRSSGKGAAVAAGSAAAVAARPSTSTDVEEDGGHEHEPGKKPQEPSAHSPEEAAAGSRSRSASAAGQAQVPQSQPGQEPIGQDRQQEGRPEAAAAHAGNGPLAAGAVQEDQQPPLSGTLKLLEDSTLEAKRQLEDQKATTATLLSHRKAKEVELGRDAESVARRLQEVENLLLNPTNPSSMLLQRIKARKEIVNKRNFLTSNLRHVEQELEKVGQNRAQLEAAIRDKVSQIEIKRQEEEDRMRDGGVEQELFELSSQAVEVGKKNLQLSRKLVSVKDDFRIVSEDVRYARRLLQRFLGKHTETSEDMDLTDMLGLYDRVAQELEEEEEAARLRAKEQRQQQLLGLAPVEEEEEGEDAGRKQRELERMMQETQVENEELHKKVGGLELHLEVAKAAWEDVQALKAKVASVKRRYLGEKEERKKANKTKQRSLKKIVLLSKHIERLMGHIKHEAVAKTRAIGYKRKALRELNLLKERGRELTKKMQDRETLITNLQQSARLLEDQLRLMDSRYLELRGKLDYTKSSSENEVRRVQLELQDVTARWKFAHSLFPAGEIEPQELRQRLHLASRMSTADCSPLSSPSGYDSPGGNNMMLMMQQGLPSIAEKRHKRGKRKVKKRVAQLEYPSLAEVIKAADPAVRTDGREHLWSQQKIDTLYKRVKQVMHKQPKKVA